ncbi:MAG: hypothetical protein JW891_02780 [Candidatus Lokiarchaeota archaeon]|nr:hypothetical protein [Candidatus Lokiarchaeota archaeon]
MKELIQNHLRYDENEVKKFLKNPRNQEMLAKIPEIQDSTFVFEVIESRGCNSGHKVGDKLYFNFEGNLLTKLCPNKICIYALNPIPMIIRAASELMYAGVDPNEMKFKSVSCPDVGLKCDGWGQIVLKFSAIKKM